MVDPSCRFCHTPGPPLCAACAVIIDTTPCVLCGAMGALPVFCGACQVRLKAEQGKRGRWNRAAPIFTASCVADMDRPYQAALVAGVKVGLPFDGSEQ